jgi:hypothetical protein
MMFEDPGKIRVMICGDKKLGAKLQDAIYRYRVEPPMAKYLEHHGYPPACPSTEIRTPASVRISVNRGLV